MEKEVKWKKKGKQIRRNRESQTKGMGNEKIRELGIKWEGVGKGNGKDKDKGKGKDKEKEKVTGR